MANGVSVSTSAALSPAQGQAVLDLAARAQQSDGAAPVNEAAILHLRRTRPGVEHVRAVRDAELVGYAQLEETDDAAVGQLVVDPRDRRLGIGATLASELVRSAGSTLQMWAAGNSPAAAGLAARVGLVKVRELLIMERPLDGDWPRPEPPADVEIRAFRPGADELAWLGVNARAFAHHPEQGQLTRADLDDRMAQAWFDPAGFLVAVRAATMVGFHWTKQHPDRLGEVYVLGVDPGSGGAGLGKLLLGAGLDHLREQGDTVVELYVEADHDRAVGLYRGYGFAVSSRDVMYARSSPSRR